MSCEAWQEALLDRVMDELREERAIQLEQHLAECAVCAEAMRRLERLMDRTRSADDWAAEPGLEERLVGTLRRQRAARAPAPWWAAFWQRRVPAYAIVAVALVGVIAGTQLGRSGTRTGQGTRVNESQRLLPAPAWRAAPPEGTLQASLPKIEFAATPSDAIATGRLSSPDSL